MVHGMSLGLRDPWFASRSCLYSSQLQETGVQKGVFGLDRFIGLVE